MVKAILLPATKVGGVLLGWKKRRTRSGRIRYSDKKTTGECLLILSGF